MWQTSALVRLLWVASPVILCLVIAAMLRRGLYREFPWFFAYCGFAAVTSLIGVCFFLTHHLDGKFVYFLLIHESGCIILRFAAIYELFTILIRPYPALKNSAHWLFRITMAALILGGVGLAASYHWAPGNPLIPASVNLADRTVDVIQCGILLLLVICSKYLRLSWRDYGLGIAIGLGIYAAVDLSIAAVLVSASSLPRQQQKMIDLRMTILSMSTYLFAILIWLFYALLPERVPRTLTTVPEHDLEAWNHELERLLQR